MEGTVWRGVTLAGIDQSAAFIKSQFVADTINIGLEDNPKQLYDDGKRAVTEKLYGHARQLLSKAIVKGLTKADAHYYLTLAILEGRKPTLHKNPRRVMAEAEAQLERALRLNRNCEHAYALLAAIRRNYYRDTMSGRHSVDELLKRARGMKPEHAAELAPFIGGQTYIIWRETLERAQNTKDERDGRSHSRPSGPMRSEKYFIPDPLPPDYARVYGAMVVGALSVVLGVVFLVRRGGAGGHALGVGLFLMALAAFALAVLEYVRRTTDFRRRRHLLLDRPTDEDMDRWLDVDRFLIIKDALDVMERDIDELAAEPYMVIGPAKNSLHAVGKDGMTRFSHYQVVVLLLAVNRLSVYACEWNFLGGWPVARLTFDCRYSDITGLTVKEAIDDATFTLRSYEGRAERVRNTRVFEMIIAGTDRIGVVVRADISEKREKIPPTGATAAESRIRWMLNRNH
jgi:hypothetical protein